MLVAAPHGANCRGVKLGNHLLVLDAFAVGDEIIDSRGSHRRFAQSLLGGESGVGGVGEEQQSSSSLYAFANGREAQCPRQGVARRGRTTCFPTTKPASALIAATLSDAARLVLA
jgi:hypothetical protein